MVMRSAAIDLAPRGGVERIGKMCKTTRLGLYKCYQCYKPFTVRVGTVFEASHIPLRYWLQAILL